MPPPPPERRSRSLFFAAVLASFALLIYGRQLGISFLSDDFVYVQWAAGGVRSLLRWTTIDSTPRMIRPLPAMLWLLASLPGAAFLLHATSFAMHVLNACLIGTLLRREGRPAAVCTLIPFLFVAFPLFAEPVIWPCANYDLWACAAALLAILAATSSTAPAAGAAALFALALLCKESVVTLPLLVPLLAPWHRVRRPVVAMAAVAAAYLALRWLLFGGLGGYLDEQGRSLAMSVRPLAFARAVALQLPYRVLMPLPTAGGLAPVITIASVVLLAGLLYASGLWRRPAALARIAAVGLIAILPAAPVLHVEWDHEGARLLYFPVAAVLLALGLELRTMRRPAAVLAGTLAAGWTAMAIANGGAWVAASNEVKSTLAAMEKAQAGFPAGAEVWVDAHDTRRGAYVFRNGLPEAARQRGLRQDVTWRRGTPAAAGPGIEARLGRNLFAIGADERSGVVDWTACETALRAALLRPVATWASPERLPGAFAAVPASPGGIAVRLETGSCAGAAGPVTGTLFWRTDDVRPFTMTESRVFSLTVPDGSVVVRLPPETAAAHRIELRVDLDKVLPPACWRSIAVAPSPAACGDESPHPPIT
jgi:hypothetical protein